MQRRKFLLACASSSVVATSGCASVVREKVSSVTGSPKKLGDSVTHRGVKVTPDAFTTADNVTVNVADGGAPEESAPTGATYVFTHLTVEHVGENERVFPSRGTFSGSPGDRIKHFYKDERLSTGRFEDVAAAFRIDGYDLTSYLHTLLEKDAASAVYSGVTASGWLMNEIPAEFTPGEATVEITWGASSTLSEEGQETFTWTFTPDARLTPAEAAKKSESDDNTIDM